MSLTYRSFLFQQTGYGLAAHQDILSLADAGADFKTSSLTPSVYQDGIFGRSQDAAKARHDPNAWKDSDTVLYRSIPTDAIAPFWRGRSDSFQVRANRVQKLGLFTVFESPVWPKGWRVAANAYDGLSVPAGWLALAAREAGVEVPIHVIPHALEFPDKAPEPALPKCEAWWEAPIGDERIKVLCEGTYMLRKNIPAVVEAFYRAFNPLEAVLLIHTHYFKPVHKYLLMGELREVRERLKIRHAPPVLISDARLSWDELWSLFSWSTIYCSLAYAEGVGYPLLFAGGLGIPIVCTDHVGHRNTAPQALFAKSSDRLFESLEPFDPLVKYDNFQIAHIHPEDVWRRPDPSDAAYCLQDAAKVPKDFSFGAAVRIKHDPLVVGKQIKAFAESLG